MRALDCCAAPGGKSFAAALQMQDRGTLYSCDIHPHRLDLIERGAERLGISILETHLQDASQPVPAWRSAMDVVLADVPDVYKRQVSCCPGSSVTIAPGAMPEPSGHGAFSGTKSGCVRRKSSATASFSRRRICLLYTSRCV